MYNATQMTLGYARSDLVCPKDRCYKVNSSSGLNVRSGAGTNYSTIVTVPNGTYLEVLSVMDSVSWCRVRVRTGNDENTIGFVNYSYIVQVNNNASPYLT